MFKSLRFGSWSRPPYYLRMSLRGRNDPDDQIKDFGLRVACNPSPEFPCLLGNSWLNDSCNVSYLRKGRNVPILKVCNAGFRVAYTHPKGSRVLIGQSNEAQEVLR